MRRHVVGPAARATSAAQRRGGEPRVMHRRTHLNKRHEESWLAAVRTVFFGMCMLAFGSPRPIIGQTSAQQAIPTADARSLATTGAVLDTLLPPLVLAAIRRYNPDVIARRAALAAAQSRVRAAGFTPAAVLTAELEDSDGANVGRAGLRLGVEREMFSGARRRAARALAEAEARGAEAAIRVTEQRAAAAAIRALTEAVAWSTVAARQASQDSLLAAAEEGLRARFAVGAARYVEVLRLRTERLRVQSERAASMSDARTGALALAALVGSPTAFDPPAFAIDSLIRTAAPLFTRSVLPPLPAVDSLLATSGILSLLRADVAQAIASRALLSASQRPLVIAGLGVQRTGGAEGAGLGPTAAFAMSLPFTARRANAAALQTADRTVDAAESNHRATLSALRSTLRAQRERYDAARIRLSLFDAGLLRGAREERESALAAYRAGELTLLELLDFERALSSAEIERTRAMVDAARALADLFSTAAGLVESLRADLPPLVQVTDER